MYVGWTGADPPGSVVAITLISVCGFELGQGDHVVASFRTARLFRSAPLGAAWSTLLTAVVASLREGGCEREGDGSW